MSFVSNDGEVRENINKTNKTQVIGKAIQSIKRVCLSLEEMFPHLKSGAFEAVTGGSLLTNSSARSVTRLRVLLRALLPPFSEQKGLMQGAAKSEKATGSSETLVTCNNTT
jgi:hypothetical protein